jgi:uracil-DNA glycosylase family 4
MLTTLITPNSELLSASRAERRDSVELAFERLACDARSCTACPRMEGRRRVLGRRNGALDARVLFVAEAPGRLGAEVTGIPLAGDQSGRNFERMLGEVGLTRDDVFVTNAVLCNPLTPDGRNDKPSASEIANCNPFLSGVIDVIAPDLVIALGVAALSALARIEPHGLTLRENLARPVPWSGRLLTVLFHPSPRTQVFRSLAEQATDLARCLDAASPYRDVRVAARGRGAVLNAGGLPRPEPSTT